MIGRKRRGGGRTGAAPTLFQNSKIIHEMSRDRQTCRGIKFNRANRNGKNLVAPNFSPHSSRSITSPLLGKIVYCKEKEEEGEEEIKSRDVCPSFLFHLSVYSLRGTIFSSTSSKQRCRLEEGDTNIS